MVDSFAGYAEASVPDSPADPAQAMSKADTQRILYETYYDRVTGYVFSLVQDRHLSSDLAQEAFVRLYTNWAVVGHPTAYLYLTATNLVRRHARRRHTEAVALARLAADRAQIIPAYDPALRDALLRLPRRLRQAVVLHYLADLPVTEVAAHLHITPGTVKRFLYEARIRLAAALEDTP